jgi:hypothetical protein
MKIVYFLLYVVLFYYLMKFAFRLLAPYLLKKAANKVQDHLKKQFEQQQYNQTKNQEAPKQNVNPKPKKQVGEYIDYEEIE